MKKIFMAVGALIAVIVVLVMIAAVIVYVKVDKTFIESQVARALSRQVTLEKIDVSLFSIVSGIEIKNLALSNFKTSEQLAQLKDQSVSAADLFAGIEALRFKVKFLPLLERRVELKELVLYSPVINLSRNRQGVSNIEDLIKSVKKPADQEKREPQAKAPAKPLSADDIPVALSVGEIGMKNATINYYDGVYDQGVQIYKLSALAHDISIDPKELEKKDEIKLKLGMGIKTVGAMKTGSVQSFDVTIEASGKVIPFDVKTRLLEPEAILHVAIPDGEMTGLQIFNAVAAIPILGDYLGKHLSFLRGRQAWKGSRETGLDLRYKAANAEFANGRIDLNEASILFDGGMNMDSNAIDMNLGMVMKKEINDSVKAALAEKIESAVKSPEVKKFMDSGKLAEASMRPLLNKDGRIDLRAKIVGTTKKPDARLTQPQLSALGNIVKDAAGSVAIEAGKSAVKKMLKEDQGKVLEDVERLFKRK